MAFTKKILYGTTQIREVRHEYNIKNELIIGTVHISITIYTLYTKTTRNILRYMPVIQDSIHVNRTCTVEVSDFFPCLEGWRLAS